MNKLKSIMKKSRFWKVYIISISILLCLIVAFFILLAFVLSDYENSLGSKTLNNIVKYVEKGEFDYILDNADVIKSGLGSKEEYEEALLVASNGKEITIGTAYSYDSENKPMYSIKADKEVLFNVVLKKSKDESTFGFTKYEFDYITDFSFGKVDITFKIEDNMVPYIDDVKIDDTFYAKNYFSSDISEGVEIKQYEINGLMKYPKLLVVESNDYGNIEINNLIETESKYLIPSQGDEAKDIDSIAVSYWNGKYNVEAKYGDDDKAAVDYDVENKSCSVSHKTFLALIPSNYTNISINGNSDIELEKYLIEDNVNVDELTNVPEAYCDKPHYKKYKFSVKSGELELKAFNTSGDEVLFDYDSDNLLYTGNFVVKDKEADKFNSYYEIAKSGAENYAKFITGDVYFGSLAKDMVADTVMYQTMNEYYKHSQHMYTDHDSTEFKNTEAYDLKIYDENCFSCAVHLEQWIYGQRDNPDFEASIIADIRIWFVNDNGKWKMADYELFDRK